MNAVEVVLANNDRATIRVEDVFLKVDSDHDRSAREAEAMALAPLPTPEILWRKPPVLALARVPGAPLDLPGQPSTASAGAWAAAGAAVRALHDSPLPPWPLPYTNASRWESAQGRLAPLAEASERLAAEGILAEDVVTRNRERAELVLQPWRSVFIHGDLHIKHVFVDDDELTGIIDWSEAAPGDGAFDLASLTLAHPERLADLLTGYGSGVDHDAVEAWWAYRCITAIPWLIDNGYGPPDTYPEVAMLRSLQ